MRKRILEQSAVFGAGLAVVAAVALVLGMGPSKTAGPNGVTGKVSIASQGGLPMNDDFNFNPAAPLLGSPGGFCAADLTGPDGVPDGNVDALDFLRLNGQWASPCVGICDADITGPTPFVPDGNVDSLDFLLLIAQWGTPANCP